jgi:hypothetical protein
MVMAPQAGKKNIVMMYRRMTAFKHKRRERYAVARGSTDIDGS